MPPFCVGFSKLRKKPGWRRSSNCVQNAFFQLFPSWPDKKKQPSDQILQFRFHATILCGLFQAAEKAGLTKVVQLRSKRVFSTFPILARQKKTAVRSNFTISVSCHHFVWAFPSSGKSRVDEGRPIAFKTRFFNFSHLGQTKKTAVRSNFTISVSCHHFVWSFPSSGKSRVDEGRPIAFKTRFFNFSHLGQTKKTAVRSNFSISVSCHHFVWAFPSSGKSRVDEGRPIAFKTRFFNFSHLGQTKKTAVRLNFTISVSCHHFVWSFPSSGKSRVDEGRPIAFKTRFFNFSHLGQTKKTAVRSNFTISVSCHHFVWAFPSCGKSRVDEGRPIAFKMRFFNFSHLGQTKKNSRQIKFYNFGFMPPFCVGFSKQRKKPGWRRSSNCVQNAFFQLFPSWPDKKNSRQIKFYNCGFMPPFCVGFSKQRKKPGWRRSSNCVQNAFFQLSPSGRSEKTALGSNFKISVSCHHFVWSFPSSGKSRVDEGRPITFKTRFFNFSHLGQTKKTAVRSNFTISVSCHHFVWAFPSSGKSRVDEGRPIAFKTRFFNFPHLGEAKKQPWDRILQFRFHATILCGLFQAAEKAGLTKVVQLRSKRVFSTFPILARQKKQPSDQILQFRFHATILCGLFQAAEKAGLTKVVQLRSKRVFSTFPIWAKRKNSLDIEFYNFGFMPPFCVLFNKQRKKPGWRRSSNCVQNAFFQLSPSGRSEKKALGSNFTISVSCHHFGWAFPSSGKSRVDEGRPIAFKTRFFNFPHRGEANKQPWDRILQFRFHATILGGLFQAAEKAGLTKVVQLRSKRVFSTFPIGAKRKKSLGIEFYNFGFMPPFWVGFSKQRKKPGWRRSSNCV